MKMIDLFSGIGGFSLAAKWAGIKTIQFVEKDTFCQKVLAKNFPGVPIHTDIKDFQFTEKVDVLTGGFPCQPFSVAGKKKGFNDDRSLWPDMFRIIRECKPTWIIAENVSGIIPWLDVILEDLEREAYTWQAYLIPASSAYAPHKRERLFIIANSDGKRCNVGNYNRERRSFSDDFDRHYSKIYQEWDQCIPKSWKTFNAQEFIANANSITRNEAHKNIEKEKTTRTRYIGNNRKNTTRFNWEETKPPVPGVDDGLPDLVDRNKSLGNAIVPQVVYPFLKCIKELQ